MSRPPFPPTHEMLSMTAAVLAGYTPFSGQETVETDTGLRKVGDGVTQYTDLAYLPDPDASAVSVTQATQYRTLVDKTQQLAQVTPPAFGPLPATGPGSNPITVRPDVRAQRILGFGAALTDAAAYCLTNYLTPAALTALLNELYSPSQGNWTMLRIAIGQSDFTGQTVSSYDDQPTGSTDASLTNFSIAQDQTYLLPLVQRILAINPKVKIYAVPWSPPVWMKTVPWFLNGNSAGNPASATQLASANFTNYVNYIVKTIQAYQAMGIPIHATSIVNEPSDTNGSNCYFTDADYQVIMGSLGTALDAAGLETKVWAHDHHWSLSAHVFTNMATNMAKSVDGIAWHAYSGTAYEMTKVKQFLPSASHHMTEYRVLSTATDTQETQAMMGAAVIATLRNFGESVTLWNLALDQSGNPNRGSVNGWGQASGRRGVLTIDNGTGAITRNQAFYALTQVSKFLQPNAVRIGSLSYAKYDTGLDVQSVAFENPDRSIVCVVYNNAVTSKTTMIVDARTGTGFPVTLAPQEISTFVWGTSVAGRPTAAAVTPAAPGTVTATPAVSGSQVTLTWNDPAPTAPVASYTVQRSTTAGGTKKVIGSTQAGTLTFVDQLTASGTYYYTVTAVNAGGSSTSAEVSATVTLGNITVDSSQVATTGATAAGSLTWSHTVGSGANRMLLVAIEGGAAGVNMAISGVTYGGVAMTKLIEVSTASGSQRAVSIWYLANPTSGAANIVATNTGGTANLNGSSLSLAGAKQSSSFGTPVSYAAGTTVLPTLQVAGVLPDDLVVSGFVARTTTAPTIPTGNVGYGQAAIGTAQLGGTNTYGLASYQRGAGVTNSQYSFTPLDNAVAVAVAVHAA